MRVYILKNLDTQCPYREGNVFTSEHFIVESIDEASLENLLVRGYRHFGRYFFRPVCSTCHQCIPVRIPLAGYVFRTNARRIFRKNRSFTVTLGYPKLSEEAYSLYKKHQIRFDPSGDDGGEESSETSFQGFADSFFQHLPLSFQLS
ncbi:MAG: hypothetical protein AB1798_20445, partial [Spirochaetota bacterium]